MTAYIRIIILFVWVSACVPLQQSRNALQAAQTDPPAATPAFTPTPGIITIQQTAGPPRSLSPAEANSQLMQPLRQSGDSEGLKDRLSEQVYALIDAQVGSIQGQMREYWESLDPPENEPSSQGFYAPKLAAITTENETQTFTTGPEVVNGMTVTTVGTPTPYIENGKVGALWGAIVTQVRQDDDLSFSYTEKQENKIDLPYCPDHAGRLRGSRQTLAQRDMIATLQPSGDTRSLHVEVLLETDILIQVNDRAEVENVDLDVQYTRTTIIQDQSPGHAVKKSTQTDSAEATRRMADFDAQSYHIVGGSYTYKVPGGLPLDNAVNIRLVLRDQAEDLGNVIGAIIGKARQGWQGGECVQVVFLEGGEDRIVHPGEQVKNIAELFHKQDGVQMDGLITSEPDNGSVNPQQAQVQPPAEFIYTAPTGKQTGYGGNEDLVLFESVSKRGIGKKYVRYTLVLPNWRGEGMYILLTEIGNMRINETGTFNFSFHIDENGSITGEAVFIKTSWQSESFFDDGEVYDACTIPDIASVQFPVRVGGKVLETGKVHLSFDTGRPVMMPQKICTMINNTQPYADILSAFSLEIILQDRARYQGEFIKDLSKSNSIIPVEGLKKITWDIQTFQDNPLD